MSRKTERRLRLLQALLAAITAVAACRILWPVAPWAGCLLALILLGLAHSRMMLAPGTAILTYHSISDDAAWLPWSKDIAVSRQSFAAHLQTLKAMAVPVLATRDYVAMRQRGDALPPRAVVLHFDDGYFDNWCHAVPLLIQHGFPATFFVSLNFIEPGNQVRTSDDRPGYMSWAELRAIEATPGLEIEPHGIDHARIAVAGAPVARLTAENWRDHLWLQWAASPGPKNDWYDRPMAWAVPLGSLVPPSRLALASPGLSGTTMETEADLATRVRQTLEQCNATFTHELGRRPRIFCWPENKCSAAGRAIAHQMGYAATTGGNGRNATAEEGSVLSRVHVPDRSLGFSSPRAEGFALRALIGAMHGNLYWYPVLLAMQLTRRIVRSAGQITATKDWTERRRSVAISMEQTT
jgi:peptidoglycan/xylan/chitin deacetylase (PgdA/CDA1 family)